MKEFKTVFAVVTGNWNPGGGKHLHNTMWTELQTGPHNDEHFVCSHNLAFLVLSFYSLKRLYATCKFEKRDVLLLTLPMLYDCVLVSVNLLLFYIKKHSCQPISWVQGTLMAVTTICKMIQAFLTDSPERTELPSDCSGIFGAGRWERSLHV